MRVLVVDDRSDVRRGREAILRDAGIDTVGLDFHAALFEPVVWSHFDRVLLDARDDSPYPTQIGNTPDRFLGPRVAERIASEESAHKPVVILVSLHVRENEWLAARCAESGVDYTYDQRDLLEESHWLQVVTHPEAPGNAVELGRVVLSRRRGIARAIDEVETSYYLRLHVEDKPGVLADVTRILADQSISIDAMLQREPEEGEAQTDIIILTHLTIEKNMNAAIAKIESLDAVTGKVVRLRLENL